MFVVSVHTEENAHIKNQGLKKINEWKQLSLGLISLSCHLQATNALILLHLTGKGFTNHVENLSKNTRKITFVLLIYTLFFFFDIFETLPSFPIFPVFISAQD